MTSRGETWRLFVAIELPETWLEALVAAQRALAEAFETPRTPRLRWVRAEGIHLTLARVPDATSLDAQETRDVMARMQTLKCPPLTVRNVSLMRSHLGPGGSRYERVTAFPEGSESA